MRVFEPIRCLDSEFDRRAEEVVIQAPLIGVEFVEQGNHTGVVESIVTDPLPDMGPVFLFDMGVVVLVICAASSKTDGAFSVLEVSQEVVVEELRAVIAVEAQQRERQGLFDVTYLPEHIGFAPSPDRALFGPTGGDIHTVNGVCELAGHAGAAVGHRIGFDKPGTSLIPLVNGDLVAQQGAGFGCRTAAPGIANARGLEKPRLPSGPV